MERINMVCEKIEKKIVSPTMIKKILKYYWVKYVKDVCVLRSDSSIFLYSNLGIDTPWYCDSTGHLNAVELNLAFNQLMYIAIEQCIEHSWLDSLNEFNVDYFMNKYWQDFLITKIQSDFKSPLNSKEFCGVLRISKVRNFFGNIKVDLDLTTENGHNKYIDPGVITCSYSTMSVIIKNYKHLPKVE